MPPNAPTNSDLERTAQAARQAQARFARADYPAAESLYTEALALYEAGLGPDHPAAASCRLGLCRVRNTQGRFAEERRLVEQALSRLSRDPTGSAAALYALGEIIANLGDLPGGIQHLRRSYEIRRKALGPAHPETLDSISLLALNAFWKAEHNLLALYGLPNDRAGLRRFLETSV